MDLLFLDNSKSHSSPSRGEHQTLTNVLDQCLDVVKESTPGTQTPYISVADLQTWECDRDGDRDPFQIFFQDTYPM